MWTSKKAKTRQSPRQARPCCTSEAHKFGGVGDASGEKRESFRDSTPQLDHLGHPSPTVSSCSRVFAAQRTPHPRTPPRDTTAKEPFWQVQGGGVKVRFFGISGLPRKSGVLAVTGGSHHGHKLVARETGVSLESFGEVYA